MVSLKPVLGLDPRDGHTLRAALEQVEQLTGIKPVEANVDLGYRGHGISKKMDGCDVILAHQKRGITQLKRSGAAVR